MFHPHEIVKHPCEFSCMYIWIFSDIIKYHIEIHNRHLLKIICPCHCMFVYHVSKITENTKRSSKYICAKFIYISRNFSAHNSAITYVAHWADPLLNKNFIRIKYSNIFSFIPLYEKYQKCFLNWKKIFIQRMLL